MSIAVIGLAVTNIRFTGSERGVGPPIRRGNRSSGQSATRPGELVNHQWCRTGSGRADAGLGRVDVSMNSIDQTDFAATTRRDQLADVMPGLAAANKADLPLVKAKSVLDRTRDSKDIVERLRFCLNQSLSGAGHQADTAGRWAPTTT